MLVECKTYSPRKKLEKKTGAGVLSQWLVGSLLKDRLKSHEVPSNDPTSDCEMRLAPDFFTFLKCRLHEFCREEKAKIRMKILNTPLL